MILEKYVRAELDKAKKSYILDSSWKKILGKNIKVPDFTIVEDDATIFVEVKRKHISNIVKVFQTNDALAKNLDDSVVSGVLQIYSLADELLKNKSDKIKSNTFYGIVVGYKESYLRGGQQFWNEFLSEAVTAELAKLEIDPNIIPPSNLLLLSVDDFDFLMAVLDQNSELSFASIFSKVGTYDDTPEHRSFFFQDHLERITGNKKQRPEHLMDRITDVIEEITSTLQKAHDQKLALVSDS